MRFNNLRNSVDAFISRYIYISFYNVYKRVSRSNGEKAANRTNLYCHLSGTPMASLLLGLLLPLHFAFASRSGYVYGVGDRQSYPSDDVSFELPQKSFKKSINPTLPYIKLHQESFATIHGKI